MSAVWRRFIWQQARLGELREQMPHCFDGELAAATITAVAVELENEKRPRDSVGGVSVGTGS